MINKSLRNRVIQFFLVIMLIFLVCPVYAQRKITIKLASLVPENTSWGTAINRMAADWAKATNGEVEVIVFHSGTAGDEPEVLRKLRLNQIQAAVFTSVGLNSVTPEALAVSYPFLIRDNAELDAVMLKIKPELDAKIQSNGFVTLAWARAGWLRIFSRTPVYVPNDLRKLKLATGADELELIQAFRIMGYQMVPIELSELLPSLNSGSVDAVYHSPIFTAGNQVFGIAKNMASISVAPFMGGLLMNTTAWRKIPEKYRPELLTICKQMEKNIESSISNLESDAIAGMVKYGLTINQLTPQQVQEWYDDTDKYESNLVGNNPIFSKEYYQKIKAILSDFRKGR